MKKILAVLIALMMITACAAEEGTNDSVMQDFEAEESGFSSEADFEQDGNSSDESSSEQSESSLESGNTVSAEEENAISGDTSGGSTPSSESSSVPTIISGGSYDVILPGNSPLSGDNIAAASFVKRANASGQGSEETMWKRYAVNEKTKDSDKPLMLFTDADKLASFCSDMGGIYQFGSGAGSVREFILSYGEEFFEENALMIIHIRSSSGSVRYEVKGAYLNGGECSVAIGVSVPEVGTADMADWFIFVECPKEAISGCDSYKVNLS